MWVKNCSKASSYVEEVRWKLLKPETSGLGSKLGPGGKLPVYWETIITHMLIGTLTFLYLTSLSLNMYVLTEADNAQDFESVKHAHPSSIAEY